MEIIFEVLFQFVFEIVIEVVGQILIEVGLEGLSIPFRNGAKRNPIVSVVVYTVFGALFGFVSTLIFPETLIQNAVLKIAYFAAVPIFFGFFLSAFSWLTLRKAAGESFFSAEKFICGVLFAALYSLARFYATH